MSAWPIFTTTNTYPIMSVFEKMELFKMVLQYWVYQNVIEPSDAIPDIPTHVGTKYINITNIITYISICTWNTKWKSSIDLNQFKKDFIMYVNDPKVTTTFDPNINIFRTKFGPIIGINDLTLLKKKEMYRKIINYWIDLQKLCSNPIYNVNEIKDEINKIINESINDYTNVTYTTFMSSFNKYVAGVSIEEDPNAVRLRNTTGFIFPKCYYVERTTGKRARIENIIEIEDSDKEPDPELNPSHEPKINDKSTESDDSFQDENLEFDTSIWMVAAAAAEAGAGAGAGVGAEAGAGVGAAADAGAGDGAADINYNKFTLPKCGNCGKTGHNVRTCSR